MAGERAQYDDRGQSESGPGSASRAGSGGDASDDLDGVVLDDDFIRSAETSEPSARARMLAARWRREEPEPQPWRSDEPPAGWFFSKARRRRWRKR
ncbi:SGM_3592 family protein [Streptomyces afghaniensis]|uniref:SGM_3592 family protein n=1 Tax=Streptomyces afghaniensis TaxID=66865 RepID=UPI0027817611|nr:hypothetical protein [Streptomyces afghaniensis]MDQ1017965.1 hypothetical protein [Streptomyces afghaniensis]